MATSNYQPVAYQANAIQRATQQESGENEANEAGEGGERGEVRGEREGGEGAPPPLAPLSLSGLALMGAVVLLAKQDNKTAAGAAA